MTDIDTSREAVERLADWHETDGDGKRDMETAVTLRALLARVEAAESECARWEIATHESQRRYFEVVGERDAAKAEADRLREALKITRDKLESVCRSEFECVWTEEDFAEETKEADTALQENAND